MAFTAQQLQDIMQAAITAVQAQSQATQATQATNDESRPRLKAPERPEVDLGHPGFQGPTQNLKTVDCTLGLP